MSERDRGENREEQGDAPPAADGGAARTPATAKRNDSIGTHFSRDFVLWIRAREECRGREKRTRLSRAKSVPAALTPLDRATETRHKVV